MKAGIDTVQQSRYTPLMTTDLATELFDVTIYPPDTNLDPADVHWMISGDVARDMPGWSNLDVESGVSALLPSGGGKFSYDSDMPEFVGYTLSETDAYRMIKAIERVVQRTLKVDNRAASSDNIAPAPDAWEQLHTLQERFTREFLVRDDLVVTALAARRKVRLRVGQLSYNFTKADPRDRTPEPTVTSRNVGTMRELALALIAACDFVDQSNPKWASHPAHNHTNQEPDQ